MGLNGKIAEPTNIQGKVIKIYGHRWNKADCKIAFALIKDTKIDILIADLAYNTNYIVKYVTNNGIEIILPPPYNKKLQRNFDDFLYFCWHIIESTFLASKRWHGIATHYFKTSIVFFSPLFTCSISISISSQF